MVHSFIAVSPKGVSGRDHPASAPQLLVRTSWGLDFPVNAPNKKPAKLKAKSLAVWRGQRPNCSLEKGWSWGGAPRWGWEPELHLVTPALPGEGGPLVQRPLLLGVLGHCQPFVPAPAFPSKAFSQWFTQLLWFSAASSDAVVTSYYPQVLFRAMACQHPVLYLVHVLQSLM